MNQRELADCGQAARLCAECMSPYMDRPNHVGHGSRMPACIGRLLYLRGP